MDDEVKAVDVEDVRPVMHYVTLVELISTDDKKFTVELFSPSAEQAFFKEHALDRLFGERDDIKSTRLIGTFKRVNLRVIGE